jgi:DNA-binding transcriptional LysR family regulator
MEMHQLRYFVAIARTGSFSRAAVQCRVAQPSLSQQIQKLESEVGDRLFERTRRQAILTPAGTLFFPHALSILETAEQAIFSRKGLFSCKKVTASAPRPSGFAKVKDSIQRSVVAALRLLLSWQWSRPA